VHIAYILFNRSIRIFINSDSDKELIKKAVLPPSYHEYINNAKVSNLSEKILLEDILSEDILCLFERPPFVRCKNGYCTKIHLEGRAAYIESLKKRVIPTNKLTTELTKHEYKNNSSEVSIVDNNTINIDISEIDAIAIAEALSDIEIKTAKEQEYDGPWLEC
jgi:hypothetical protein